MSLYVIQNNFSPSMNIVVMPRGFICVVGKQLPNITLKADFCRLFHNIAATALLLSQLNSFVGF